VNAVLVHLGDINKITFQAKMDLELNLAFFIQNLHAYMNMASAVYVLK
jgi:hypothetical protein